MKWHIVANHAMSKLKCPDYGGVLISEGVVLCTGFNRVELWPEYVSLLEVSSIGSTLSHVQQHAHCTCIVNTKHKVIVSVSIH